MVTSTASAMNSSIKANNSLGRIKSRIKKFRKQSNFTDTTFRSLSKEENLIVVAQNKVIFEKETESKNLYGLMIVVFYTAILVYALSVFLN